MNWTAVVPLKQAGERKTRLSARLSAKERAVLSDTMARHVVDCLRASPAVGTIRLLSPEQPPMKGVLWARDDGRGLNEELAALRVQTGASPFLVIHADLPLLSPDDIDALITATGSGCALAPDRHGGGTNAIALADGLPFSFAFGPGSATLHQAAAPGVVNIVQRAGLMLDIDTPDDLDAAIAAGFRRPETGAD